MLSIQSSAVRVKEVLSLVRLKPFDGDSARDRERERYRRAALTAGAAAAAKCVNVVAALITVPLTLQYLGPERYGLWMTMSSFIVLLGFTDCGLGNGLVNAISEAHGRNDRELGARNVSSALFMLLGIAIMLGCLCLVAFPFVQWPRVFNVTSARAAEESGPALAVLSVCFLVGLPLSVVSRVQRGYQEGFLNSAWQVLGNVAGLVGVIIAVKAEVSLPWLVGAMAVPPLVATLLNGVHLFWVKSPWLKPSWRSVTLEHSCGLLRVGGVFLLLQLAAVVTFASDSVIIAQICGAASVAEYSVPMRLFSIAPMLVSLVVSPLWPAYGEAVVRDDVAWIRRTLFRSLVFSLFVTGSAGAILVAFGRSLIHFWVGPAVAVSSLLLFGMGIWTVMYSAGEAVAMLLNGTNRIHFQAVTGLITCCVAVAAKIALGRALGLSGVVLGTVLAYAVFTAIPMLFFVPKLLREFTSRASPFPT